MASNVPVTVLDPKYDYHAGDSRYVYTPEFRKDLPYQVIRPVLDGTEEDAWDHAILGAWYRGDGILYVDEINLLNPSTRVVRPSLGRAIRTGGGRGLGTWSGTQRPKDIPSVYFTEAEHFIIFQLTYKGDREKVVSFTHDGIEPLLAQAKRHNYVYYSIFSERPILVRATQE